jgi:TetR/AcrR family transcriptional regulator, regulator of cefoperazone and chloramphenicol sensitivity
LKRAIGTETFMDAIEPTACKHGQTRTRLLDAACKVFAEKGFRDATIADICKLANANIAAVNYHFRDKETLYAEAWRQAFRRSIEAHPFDGGVPATAPAADRLRGHIHGLIHRTSDIESYELEIIHKELANPTGLLVEAVTQLIVPFQQAVSGVVRELLGARASDQQVHLWQYSILMLCLHPGASQCKRKHLPAEVQRLLPSLNVSIQDTVDHITLFSLAGIEAQRRRIESGEADDRK